LNIKIKYCTTNPVELSEAWAEMASDELSEAWAEMLVTIGLGFIRLVFFDRQDRAAGQGSKAGQ
jgi:hypothetical protein